MELYKNTEFLLLKILKILLLNAFSNFSPFGKIKKKKKRNKSLRHVFIVNVILRNQAIFRVVILGGTINEAVSDQYLGQMKEDVRYEETVIR
jgi:hypothetical protein